MQIFVPICASERLITHFGFRQVIGKGAAQIIMPDMSRTGGLTETRKIAAMADTYYLPVTCHDVIGPVALWSAAQLMLHIPNGAIEDTSRANYLGWYGDVVTVPLPIADGMLLVPNTPGLGIALREDVLNRLDVHVEVSDLQQRYDASRG